MDDGAAPAGWLEDLLRGDDLEHCYLRLEGFDHFFSSALRGRVRSLQSRVDEAHRHFREARRLFERKEAEDFDDEPRFFYLNAFDVENCVLKSAIESSSAPLENARFAIRFLERQRYFPLSPYGLTKRSTLATFDLACGHGGRAWERFEEILAIYVPVRCWSDYRVAFSCGGAGAAREASKPERADELIVDAEAGMEEIGVTLLEGLCCCRLHAVFTRWGRPDDAARWAARISELDCPWSTKSALTERATSLARVAVRGNALCLP